VKLGSGLGHAPEARDGLEHPEITRVHVYLDLTLCPAFWRPADWKQAVSSSWV
jgi:hypothetical protein